MVTQQLNSSCSGGVRPARPPLASPHDVVNDRGMSSEHIRQGEASVEPPNAKSPRQKSIFIRELRKSANQKYLKLSVVSWSF